MEEGNVINFGKAKTTFLALVLEEGYVKDDFKDFDEPCRPYIEELKDQKGKKKASKKSTGNPLDSQYINIDIFIRICLNEYTEIKLK